MGFIERLAEEKIRQAQKEGAFDCLEGRGLPLHLDDDSGVPPELRMGFKILKNAGILPLELEWRKEMVTLSQLIVCCDDEERRNDYRRQLSLKRLQWELAVQKGRVNIPADYHARVWDKVSE